MAQKRIVVTTFGSLGDLHPYLALALGLRARGQDTVVATGERYRDKIEALGLGFAAVRPDSAWVTDPEKMRWFSHRQWGLIRVAKMQLHWLREAYEDTLVAAAGADEPAAQGDLRVSLRPSRTLYLQRQTVSGRTVCLNWASTTATF